MTEPASWTALVLAGSRRGEGDPVARYRNVRHKSLATAGGVPLLVRVVRALTASPRIGRLLISLDDPALLDELPELVAWRASGRLEVLTSAASLSRSVADGFAAAGAPLLVTTADHALLGPGMLGAFLDAAETLDVDVAAGLAPEAVIAARFPETRRTYLRFRDGGYSGANLFALRTQAAERAIAFWERVERDRKQPWRLARALGPALLVGFLLRRWTLEQAMVRVSARLGVKTAAVAIPIAEAAIDVDKPADLDLVEAILAGREAA
jgi:GTP:adenosylcobinamide-phosphate guanylyltransferase